jgi:RimJ/RimL family protein N-acetyltransferase
VSGEPPASEGGPAEGRFDFRLLTEADLPLLREWLGRPHLQAWWRQGQRTLEEVREHYLPRIAGAGAAHPYLALLDGEPVGYIQWYRASEGTGDWWPDEPGPGVIGIDQFLADGTCLGRGLGTEMVSAFVARLFEQPAVTEIRVDPRPDNGRAIRCYEKVGFRRAGRITTPDGPALMMVLGRSAAARPLRGAPGEGSRRL